MEIAELFSKIDSGNYGTRGTGLRSAVMNALDSYKEEHAGETLPRQDLIQYVLTDGAVRERATDLASEKKDFDSTDLIQRIHNHVSSWVKRNATAAGERGNMTITL
jgi:hypothetical protein